MNVKERIIEFLDSKGISKRGFSASIGKSNSYVNNIVSTITADVITKIKEVYPDLNINWLLTGEGEMLKEESQTVDANPDIVALLKEQLKEKDDKISELSEYIGYLKRTLEENGVDYRKAM